METLFYASVTNFLVTAMEKWEEMNTVTPMSSNSDLFSSQFQDKLSYLNFYEESENCILSIKNKYSTRIKATAPLKRG